MNFVTVKFILGKTKVSVMQNNSGTVLLKVPETTLSKAEEAVRVILSKDEVSAIHHHSALALL